MLVQWGKILNIRDEEDYDNPGNFTREYEVKPTRGFPIWIPEDYIWGEKIFEGLKPECPICFEPFTNATKISILICGHLYCKKCAEKASTYRSRNTAENLQDGELNCGICNTTSRYPLPNIKLRFNEFANVICGKCKIEITDDMYLHVQDEKLSCCFCLSETTARYLGCQRIFLPLDDQ